MFSIRTELEPRALDMLVKHPTTELYPGSFFLFFNDKNFCFVFLRLFILKQAAH